MLYSICGKRSKVEREAQLTDARTHCGRELLIDERTGNTGWPLALMQSNTKPGIGTGTMPSNERVCSRCKGQAMHDDESFPARRGCHHRLNLPNSCQNTPFPPKEATFPRHTQNSRRSSPLDLESHKCCSLLSLDDGSRVAKLGHMTLSSKKVAPRCALWNICAEQWEMETGSILLLVLMLPVCAA